MNGEDILPIAQRHIGERYVLGARAVLSNPNHAGPWDCAEFASWCAYQAYGVVFGAYGNGPETADPYSGKWHDDAIEQNVAQSVEVALATPGAFLIRKPGQSGIRIGHVAICVGDGTSLVEARGAQYGVVRSTGAERRTWTIGAMLSGVTYQQNSPAPWTPDQGILKLETPYQTGRAVRKVQKALAKLGYSVGDIDGVYGPITESAVINFQINSGIAVDGQVGPDTADRLGLAWPI